MCFGTLNKGLFACLGYFKLYYLEFMNQDIFKENLLLKIEMFYIML